MHTTSLELCKELYQLSDWKEEGQSWWLQDREFKHTIFVSDDDSNPFNIYNVLAPAYALDYLIRKLPYFIKLPDARGSFQLFMLKLSNGYYYGYNKPEFGRWLDTDNSRYVFLSIHDASPEDSAAKLCIELIKQNILPKEKAT